MSDDLIVVHVVAGKFALTTRVLGMGGLAAGNFSANEDAGDGTEDDFAADTSTTGAISVGGSAIGEIESADDCDWFAVTLQEGRTYQIDLEGAATGAGNLSDPYLFGIYDGNGFLLPQSSNDDGGAGYNSRFVFTPSESGTYFVASSGAFSDTGTYKLSLREVVDDFASRALTPGDPPTGQMEHKGDIDAFAVTLEAGTTYRIDLEGAASDGGDEAVPALFSIVFGEGLAGTDFVGEAYHSEPSSPFDPTVARWYFFTPNKSGTHYLRPGNYFQDGEVTGGYRLSVAEASFTDDFASDASTTGQVSVGGSVTGQMEHKGDIDAFAVTLEAGTTYRIDLEGAASDGGDEAVPALFSIVFGEGLAGTDFVGEAYHSEPSSPFDPTVARWYFFTPNKSGTHYLRPGNYFQDGEVTGGYRLSVAEASFTDDFASDASTTGQVSVGGSVTGQMEHKGDIDAFAVTLEAGTTYRIDLEGAASDGGDEAVPALFSIVFGEGLAGTDFVGEAYHSEPSSPFDPTVARWYFFTPNKSGTHYLRPGNYFQDGEVTGGYRLSVAEASFTDDFASDASTTGQVSVGGSVTGQMEHKGDIDAFAVTLEAGTTYRIDLEGAASDGGDEAVPALFSIVFGEGLAGTDFVGEAYHSEPSSPFDPTVARWYFFTPNKSGTHYLRPGNYFQDGEVTGGYRLSVAEASFTDDFASDASTTGQVSVGGSVTGQMEHKGDIDAFAVTLEAGTTYRIDLEGAASDGGDEAVPALFSIVFGEGLAGTDFVGEAYHSEPSSPFDPTVARWYFFTPNKSGTHYLRPGNYFQDGEVTGGYRLSVAEASFTDDFASDASTTGQVSVSEAKTGPEPPTAGRILVGGSVTGEIDYGNDRDWFAVTLEAGTTYRIDLEGVVTQAGTLSDPYLYGVYDSDGLLVLNTDDDDGGTGSNSQLVFTPSEESTYYVAVAGAQSDDTGTYELFINEASSLTDDFNADTATEGRVSVGASVAGEIEYGNDRDWFAVTLTAGTTYQIDLEGVDTSVGTLADPYLYGIYDDQGNFLPETSDDDSGTGYNSRAVFTPSESGTYYLSAAGVSSDELGTYRVSVSETSFTDDFGASTATHGQVSVGASVAGEIEHSNDRDWFAVTLTAGTTYQIDLEGVDTSAGTLADPYLYGIYDAEGTLIAQSGNDDSGIGYNSRVTFSPDQSGTYYIAVAGAFSDELGTYTLSVTENEETGSASDSLSQILASGGTEAEEGNIRLPLFSEGWDAIHGDHENPRDSRSVALSPKRKTEWNRDGCDDSQECTQDPNYALSSFVPELLPSDLGDDLLGSFVLAIPSEFDIA